jgi:hypothetical protein
MLGGSLFMKKPEVENLVALLLSAIYAEMFKQIGVDLIL